MVKILKTNLLIFLILVFFLEVAGQMVAYFKNSNFLFNDYYIQARHTLFKPHPHLSVTLNKNVVQHFEGDLQYHTVTTTELGTRWTGADLTDTTKIRIACIGGSTTFCTGVTDEDTWPALLQKKLGDRYAVINYGVPAYKSVEAIIQLALYVAEMKPAMIIFYQGGNDFYNYHLDDTYPDYYYHSEVVLPTALLGTKKHESPFDKFMRQSGFFYIVHNIEEHIYKVPIPERYDVPDPVVDNLYVRNLRSMLALSSTMDAKEVMLGQVLNPFVERKETPWGIRVKNEHILPFMHRMNEMARGVCDADNTCNYYDFQNTLPWKPEHFWDDMHFTAEGNNLFAESLKNIIQSEGQIVSR